MIHLLLHNPNEFNVDIKDLKVSVLVSGTDIAGFNPQSFALKKDKEITVGSLDSPLALVPDQTWIEVTYSYGIKDLDLMFPSKVSFLYNG